MKTNKRMATLKEIKILIVVFSLAVSVLMGVTLPLLLSNNTGKLDSLGNSSSTDEEPNFDYITALFFKDSSFLISENETNIKRFLVSEKNGVGNYDAINSARVEIPEGEKKCIDVSVNPFEIRIIGTGKNKVFVTAKQRNGEDKTVQANFIVEGTSNDSTGENGNGNNTNEGKENVTSNESGNNGIGNDSEPEHYVDYELHPGRGTIKIFYYIDGKLQTNDTFEVIAVKGVDFIGDAIADEYQFFTQEKWQIIVKHIETEKETVVKN